MSFLFRIVFLLLLACSLEAKIFLGIDRLFEPEWAKYLKGKKIGLITNQTGVNASLVSSIDLLSKNQELYGYSLSCLFAPEHGLYGEGYAGEKIASGITPSGLKVYSLHGTTRRPTKEMLQGLSLLIFDIQDIGSRSYTFAATLFYVMEEAAKSKIPVLVLDRPNPLGGLLVDGLMMEEPFRSFVGYINVPYCHGMTIAELAKFFNGEYKIGCSLRVVPMKGWKRHMQFEETGLQWIPTSPNIPHAEVAFYYPTVGILGELEMTTIGIGYTLPFQVVGAPWIDGKKFAQTLRQYKLPGILFSPIHIKPFFGRYAKQACQGVLLLITEKNVFSPYKTQCAILHALRSCYPKSFQKALIDAEKRREFFYKICGTKSFFELLINTKSSFEQMTSLHQKERDAFKEKRNKYLLY